MVVLLCVRFKITQTEEEKIAQVASKVLVVFMLLPNVISELH